MKITIYRNQLKLEVDTETRKAGFFQVNENNQEALNEAQLGNEFSDKAYFERKCQQGVDDLLDVLHKFVTDTTTEADNKMDGTTSSWQIDLTFDSRRNIIAKSLASACHKFIAYNILYSWAVMTMPNLAPEYKEQREATRLSIQKIVYRKEAPTLEEE